MMKDRGVSSSDLQRAQKLSQQLFGLEKSSDRRASQLDASAAPYLKLAGGRSEEAGQSSIESKLSLQDPPHFEGWEPLIEWLMSQLGAESAFVVDTQGFVIATSGQSATDGFEGMGAELCYAAEQLERVDPAAGALLWVDLEFGRRRIVCLKANAKERDTMLLGFVGVDPDYMSSRAKLERIVVEAMNAMDS